MTRPRTAEGKRETLAGGRLAVILFNLGGPDRPEAVRPFLFNLFNDPAIIGLPLPLRGPLAALIAARRAPTAREIYARMGGRSPILPETEAQARALEERLSAGGRPVKVFIAMRYWHPRVAQTLAAVRDWGAEEIVLLPLYPQFSTTTTRSSLREWREAAAKAGLALKTHAVCCYPTEPGFIAAYREGIAEVLSGLAASARPRIIFSAHGLPERIVARGDPYQWQVEASAGAILEALARPDLEHVIAYQSRVGPLKWIGPSTDAEIERAAREGRTIVVVPLAFVSEHSETLVELDIEYRHLAEREGAAGYHRVPTVGTRASFVAALERLVLGALRRPGTSAGCGARLCPPSHGQCPLPAEGRP